MAEAARFSPIRRSPRFAPSRPVTVAMSKDGASYMYGVVANLSEGGACFQTYAVPRHDLLDVLMSFYDGEYVQTTGRVVWAHSDEGLAAVGVEFTNLTDEAREYLRSNFDSEAFTPVEPQPQT